MVNKQALKFAKGQYGEDKVFYFDTCYINHTLPFSIIIKNPYHPTLHPFLTCFPGCNNTTSLLQVVSCQ